jgi:antibiotic biosynthesis monooxygenase (ABM) superfamily enzyme
LPGAWRAASPLALVGSVLLCALLPLLAISAASVLMCEWLLAQRARSA